jgi:hypothetical protein
LSGIFWLLPMMKPKMHRGGLALILFGVCVGLGGRRERGGLLLIFFLSSYFFFK